MTPFPTIIALAGVAGSGKDTAGLYLKQQHGFARYAFTQPLYEAVQMLYGVSPLELLGDRNAVIARLGKSPRELLQALGDHVRATYGPDILIRRLAERCVARGDWNNADIVITDLRTDLEVLWIRMMGGHIWWIEGRAAAGVPPHHTEHVPALCARFFSRAMDELIVNTGDREALYRVIDGRLHWTKAADAIHLCGPRPASPTTIHHERISA